MNANPYHYYLESTVLSADPVELVRLIYREAIDAIGAARMHLAEGNIRARSDAAAKAANLVAELAQSLNPDVDGSLPLELRELYDYILRRIHAGNFEQRDAPMEEAARLLTILLDGWQSVETPAELCCAPAE